MNPAILNSDVQVFIEANLHTDISQILLKKSPFPDVSSRELAEQIDSKRRCEKKLPLWFSTPGIYYPPKLSIEQASSETTARFKATLAKGRTLLDLTGGMGVDSVYFAKAGMEVMHAEINTQLSDIAAYNMQILGTVQVAFYKGNGLNLIHKGEKFDTVFADPSRRVNAQKVFILKDCEPDILQNLDRLLNSTVRLIIKTSPLLDLQAGILELRNVTQIYILSVKNECKELLWVLDKNNTSNDPEIVCHTFDGTEKEYRFRISDERSISLTHFAEPLNFLYEPDVALLKAGCFKLITRDFNILKLNQNSHLYTSGKLIDNFTGRRFIIHQWGDYKSFMKVNKLRKANIISRNFPLSPQEIKKKHRLVDGGDDFLIFTTGPAGQLLVIHARKVNS